MPLRPNRDFTLRRGVAIGVSYQFKTCCVPYDFDRVIVIAQTYAASQRARSLSVEDAIRQALEARARLAGFLPEPPRRRDQSPAAIAARQASVNRIVSEIAAMPILDARAPRENRHFTTPQTRQAPRYRHGSL